MLSIQRALELVVEHAVARPAVETRLAEALGLRLAQEVTSDINSPPHDKAMVDGYAVRAEDLTTSHQHAVELTVIEEVTAGEVPRRAVLPGGATRIMTGAPVPENANAVVMVEQTELDGERVRIRSPNVEPGMNIMRQGASLRRGEVVMTPGRVIRPVEVGLLSEVGCARVWVAPRPSVAILATGNELVPPRAVPEAGKIRNSNGPMLAAAVAACGATPLPLGIAPDEPQQLRAKISQGLEADVLLLSGGVSAGKLDLVPETLTGLGVSQVFHKINLKPGKPLWFGVKDDDRGPRLVFGLPGNPVSAFVCFHLFVRLALSRLAGGDETSIPHVAATLAAEYDQRGDRATYYPAQLDGSAVAPVPWRGSADLRGFAAANALIHFPPGARRHQAGEQVEVLPF